MAPFREGDRVTPAMGVRSPWKGQDGTVTRTWEHAGRAYVEARFGDTLVICEARELAWRVDLPKLPPPTYHVEDHNGAWYVCVDRHDGHGRHLMMSTPSGVHAAYPEARERGRQRAAQSVTELLARYGVTWDGAFS